MSVDEGKMAPAFSLESTEGKTISLKDLKGKKVVLYFYPKDDTSGCTSEACDFRDGFAEFKKAGAVIWGVSPDDLKKHAKFRSKYELPFTLLADPEHVVAEKYGVWKEKSMYGRKYMGIERTTFVIDESGRVVKIFGKVKVPGHAGAVLEELRGVGEE